MPFSLYRTSSWIACILSSTFRILFGEYERRLVRTGYHRKVVRLHLHSIAHLGVWIEREGRSLKTIDEETLEGGSGGSHPLNTHRSAFACG